MAEKLKILIKFPNKLGDSIMATSFLRAIKTEFPDAQIDGILEKSISELKFFMPEIDRFYEFSKKLFPGISGNFQFGRMIAMQEKYDMFFCLPFSFSSALQGYFSKSKKRIGHKTEHRGFLFTHSYALPSDLHVVEDYINLLEQFLGKQINFEPPQLAFREPIQFALPKEEYIVLNVRSGPPSRFIPIHKAVDLINEISRSHSQKILLTGAPFERDYVEKIVEEVRIKNVVINLAGKTSIIELGWVLKNARAMITTDSGNAHYANALGTPTVVLFGAGLQSRCHPYNKNLLRSLQLLDLECVPCRSEHCKYGDNRCLANIENSLIIQSMKELMKGS